MNNDTNIRGIRRSVLRKATLGAALCTACVLAPAANAAPADDWQWIVAPYIWAVSIETDINTARAPDGGISTDREFPDVLDDLDGAFLGHVEGQNEQFGVFADFTYLGLAGREDRQRFSIETDLDARLFEVAAVWSPGEGRYMGWDVFAGLRYVDVDLAAKFDPVNPAFNTSSVDAGDSFNDFMLGARYTWAVTDRWGVTLRGDASFGGTEGTWSASAMGSYKAAHGGVWFVGYRYLTGEIETRSATSTINLNGPIFGYGFVF